MKLTLGFNSWRKMLNVNIKKSYAEVKKCDYVEDVQNLKNCANDFFC